eukprot:11640661-Karenia_brevis.AAC.1
MTISPSKRHNYLAIRLSRYRGKDPLVDPEVAPAESKWIRRDAPRLASPTRDQESCQNTTSGA